MKVAELTDEEMPRLANETLVRLPLGLLGFESIKTYVLLSHPEETPFSWLRVEDDPNLAFLVLSPIGILPDYRPEISDEDAGFLGLEDAQDALIYNIVTLHKNGQATVNLKGPVVINRNTWTGKQVVLLNASEHAVQHCLPVAETSAV